MGRIPQKYLAHPFQERLEDSYILKKQGQELLKIDASPLSIEEVNE
ncbi:MAG: hypothetical protein AAFR31_10840 [Cyanobacteria bacterium J06627_8]